LGEAGVEPGVGGLAEGNLVLRKLTGDVFCCRIEPGDVTGTAGNTRIAKCDELIGGITAVIAKAIAVRWTAVRWLKNDIHPDPGGCKHRPFFARIVIDRLCESLRKRPILPAEVGQPKLLERRHIANHRDGELDRLVRRVHPSGQRREQEVELFKIVRGAAQILLVVFAEHDDMRRFGHAPVAHLDLGLGDPGARDRNGQVTVLHRRGQLRVGREGHDHADDEKPPPHHLKPPLRPKP
jgi:hypothetical protein